MYSRSPIYYCLLVATLSLVESHSRHAPSSKHDDIADSCRGPIDISTKNVRFVKTASPLKIDPQKVKERVLENTGKSIVATPAQPTTAKLSGGVLGNETFMFCITTYYWNDNATDKRLYSYSTVNGKEGSRVEAVITYYNVKYGTCEEAKKYSDGLAQVAVRVNVFESKKPNPLFYEFQEKLQEIKKPRKRTCIMNVYSYIWFANFRENTKYYVYQGYFTDEKTGKTYPAITIVFPLVPENYLSLNQFKESFEMIEDDSGKQTSNVANQCSAPNKGTDIGEAEGVEIVKIFITQSRSCLSTTVIKFYQR